MVWFWSFMTYSLIGFLLEVAFAAAVGGRPDRKGLLVLPLCPVYGLGACLILLLPVWVTARPFALFLAGGLTATAAEYAAALYHEKVLGVAFWNYDGLPGNLQGRVCLPFSLAWGLLVWAAVRFVQPGVAALAAAIPPGVTFLFLLVFTADAVCSLWFLRATGDLRGMRRAGLF